MTSQPAQPSPDLSPDQGPPLADPPGWAPIPGPPPGPLNPDSPPPGEDPGSPASEAPGPGDSASSTPASTKPLSRLTRDGLADAFAAAFYGIGHVLNAAAAQHPEDMIWLPTDDETQGVGDPAARIVGRRIPNLPGDSASDVGDLIAMMIPLAVYTVRNLGEWLPRRSKRGQAPAGTVVAPAMDGQP